MSRLSNQGSDEEISSSFANRAEVAVVVNVIDKFAANFKKLGENSVGVISPYSAQINELKNALQSRQYFPSLEIQTVDGFQGREKEVIVFSAVRSNAKQVLGFLNDKRRVNVSLSRAKHCLIIIGNAKMMQGHPIWARIVQHFKSHDAIFNEALEKIGKGF